jgi:hypothetical protein
MVVINEARSTAPRRSSTSLTPAIVVFLIGFLATAAAGVHFSRTQVAYWSAVQVRFLAPYSTTNPNTLQVTTDSLVTLAGMVGRLVTDGDTNAQVVSDNVTLAGQGVRHGYSVRLPNDGGQWATNFDQPLLNVQAIGSTPQEVTRTVTSVVAHIQQKLSTVQRAQHVDGFNIVTTQVIPQNPPTYLASGDRSRAVLATLLLGIGITWAATRMMILRARRGGPPRGAAVAPQEEL